MHTLSSKIDRATFGVLEARRACALTCLRVEGCYFNVMGLPVALVERLLRECGML